MDEIDFERLYDGLDRLRQKYRLSRGALNARMVTSVIYDALEDGLTSYQATEIILNESIPSLNHYTLTTKVHFPYDLDIAVQKLLQKSGYPEPENYY